MALSGSSGPGDFGLNPDAISEGSAWQVATGWLSRFPASTTA
ncbi:MAG: hypothetical protein ACK54R_01930 [Pirellulaceae bacterium]